jgi:signal transduction histidine kinase
MPTASEILNGNSQNILRKWAKRAREEAAVEFGISMHAPRLVLEKRIPEYLNDLSGNLSSRKVGGPKVSGSERNTRKKQDKKEVNRVNQILEEYHILRQVIFETLEGEGRLENTEREIINDSLDEEVAESTIHEFIETLKGIQEKMVINLIHDLRTPITVAKLSSDIIKMNEDKPDICQKNANRIQRSLEKMEKIVNNLMNLTDLNIDKN